VKRRKESSIEGHVAVRHAAPAAATLPPASGVKRAKKTAKSGWTIVSEFERDGYEYRVLCRPLDTVDSPRLTSREEQALELAASGLSNKRIAQSLDIAPSTVGVFLFRAAAKLGVRSRGERVTSVAVDLRQALIAAFRNRRTL
jgi:DNA-binding NarL/FixJ family response regulator